MATRTIPRNTPEYAADIAIQDLVRRRMIGSQITMSHLEEIVIAMYRHTQALQVEVEALRLRLDAMQMADVDGRG